MTRLIATLLTVLLGIPTTFAHAATPGYEPASNPVGPESWWWNEDWWGNGQIEPVTNHKLTSRWIEYENGDVTVPAMVVRPDDDNQYPAVLYQHGRRGLDELVQRQARRIAARGFVVLAPDLYSGRFIEKLPIEHDYVLETDTAAGVDVLLSLPDVSTKQACIASHTRGGYYGLKTITTHGKQNNGIVCYVSWYPHMQDPNAPEPMQVYRYAIEADQVEIPVLIFFGDQEQYQRRRSIETAVASMKAAGKDATLIVYPGVGRGFDFRPPHVRTFADDLAAKDAVQRAAAFINRHLAPYTK